MGARLVPGRALRHAALLALQPPCVRIHDAEIVIQPRTLRMLLGLTLWVLAACRAARPEALTEGPLDAEGMREVPIGLCEDHPPESTSEERMREDFRALARAGVRLLRVSFGWDDLEPERDRYDFSPVERTLRLAEEHGVRLIPYVCYTPAWLAREGARDHEVYRSVPREVGELEQLMELLARRYRGRIESWEIWNEPDNQEYWLGTPAEYAALLAAGSRGVKRGDPDARVVLGGIAGHLEFLEELLTEHRIAPWVDVVNLHSYSETWSPEPLEGITPYLARAAELVRTHGESEPLWLAEVGYSSFRRERYVSDWYSARFDFEHTPAFQAAVLVRVLAMARSAPEVALIAWYELRDLPPGTEVIGDQNNRHLGVLDPDGRPKPAYAALTRALPLLSGPLRPLEVRVQSSAGEGAAHVEARAFRRADGRCLIVAWQPVQHLPATPMQTRARFLLGASTSRAEASLRDAPGEREGTVALDARAPILTADVALSPDRTHLVLIDGCRADTERRP